MTKENIYTTLDRLSFQEGLVFGIEKPSGLPVFETTISISDDNKRKLFGNFNNENKPQLEFYNPNSGILMTAKICYAFDITDEVNKLKVGLFLSEQQISSLRTDSISSFEGN